MTLAATATTLLVAVPVLVVTVIRMALSGRAPTMRAHARRSADDVGLPRDDATRSAPVTAGVR